MTLCHWAYCHSAEVKHKGWYKGCDAPMRDWPSGIVRTVLADIMILDFLSVGRTPALSKRRTTSQHVPGFYLVEIPPYFLPPIFTLNPLYFYHLCSHLIAAFIPLNHST